MILGRILAEIFLESGSCIRLVRKGDGEIVAAVSIRKGANDVLIADPDAEDIEAAGLEPK